MESFEIAMLINEIHSKMTNLIAQSLKNTGLTHQQIMIIKLVAHNKTITVSQICKEMSLSKGTVSGIVKRLEIAGYIKKEKHDEDLRNTYIVFSEVGIEFAKTFRQDINQSFSKVFTNLNSDELNKLKIELMALSAKIK